MNFSLSVALWAVNMATPVASLDTWIRQVEAQMRAAAATGAGLLLMPEYACEQWLTFAPPKLGQAEEVAWLGELAPAALSRLAGLVRTTGVGLLAGTMPHAAGGNWTNRAHLLLPEEDGVLHATQDKLCLTPFENKPGAWMFVPGNEIRVTEWRGLRIAILICLDVELPALSVRLAPLGVDLVFVPSQTGREAGYWRVFGCAKARAIELQAIVCVVGAVGTLRLAARAETNISGAAVYAPCEEALGHTGVIATAGPVAECAEPAGNLLIADALPVAAVRSSRAGGAEVWPGAWRGDNLRIA